MSLFFPSQLSLLVARKTSGQKDQIHLKLMFFTIVSDRLYLTWLLELMSDYVVRGSWKSGGA